jgi:hypothetical protein
MAMELNIFSDQQLKSIAEWQRTIDREGFALSLLKDADFSTLRGFLPVRLRDRPTGFECYHDDAASVMNSLGRSNFDRNWKFALGLRWAPDFAAVDSAWMGAIAYAAATDGVIFDYEEAKIFTPEQGRGLVRRFEREQPMLDAFLAKTIRKIAETN